MDGTSKTQVVVEIKKIGEHRGTVGWLHSGLLHGKIRIEEGKIRGSNNPGLFLHEAESGGDWLIAGFNLYNLPDPEFQHFEIIDTDPYLFPLFGTAAFQQTLRNIAQKWCDQMEAQASNEQPFDVEIQLIPSNILLQKA